MYNKKSSKRHATVYTTVLISKAWYFNFKIFKPFYYIHGTLYTISVNSKSLDLIISIALLS